MRYWIAALLVLLIACSPSVNSSGGTIAKTYPRFADSAPYDWDRRTPWSYPVHGIDVSRWQGDIDWRRVHRAGVSFAYIKATEGGDVADPLFRQNWRNAARAGVARGAYHYYYFCRSPEQQARWFIRHVPRDTQALPPVLDMEWTHTSRSCKRRPDGPTARREAERFLRLIERHYGQRPIVYTTVDFWRETELFKLRNTQFWLRSVAGLPRDVYNHARWTLWQYSGTGRVPGISGDVDLNTFSGSVTAWQQGLGS